MRLLLFSGFLLIIGACASDRTEVQRLGRDIVIDESRPQPTIRIQFTEACLTLHRDSLIIAGNVFASFNDTGLEPLPGTSVTFRDPLEDNRGVVSNHASHFILTGATDHPKNDTLYVKYVGFESQKYAVADLLKGFTRSRSQGKLCGSQNTHH